MTYKLITCDVGYVRRWLASSQNVASQMNDKQRAEEVQKRYIKVMYSVFLVTSFFFKPKKRHSDIRGIRYMNRILCSRAVSHHLKQYSVQYMNYLQICV